MKAITLWQPWASAIAVGLKQFETRGWATKYRGPIAIHAAKRWTRDDREEYLSYWREEYPDLPEMPPLGAVVAIATLCRCERSETMASRVSDTELAFGNWAPGRWVWRMRDILQLEEPIPAKGMQGLWNWERPA